MAEADTAAVVVQVVAVQRLSVTMPFNRFPLPGKCLTATPKSRGRGQTCRGDYGGGMVCTQFEYTIAAPSCPTCTEAGEGYYGTTYIGAAAMAGHCGGGGESGCKQCEENAIKSSTIPSGGCGRCGSGSGVNPLSMISESMTNNGFKRMWIPNNRLFNSSFFSRPLFHLG